MYIFACNTQAFDYQMRSAKPNFRNLFSARVDLMEESSPNSMREINQDIFAKASNKILLSVVILTTLNSVSAEVGDDPIELGIVDLNVKEPEITDVCWFDIQVGDKAPERIEISIYGNALPKTSSNFKSLATNSPGWGYKGSDIFRIISPFSLQGGNTGNPTNAPSKMGSEGRSAFDLPFAPENFNIQHNYRDAGVVSMMKDVRTGMQDSRFFVTLSPDASWADGKYSAFGRVTKGMDFIRSLANLEVVPPSNHPKTRVTIINSGCYDKQ